ncbi:glycine cleavage system aminomethyltransferase GcvT [Microvirga lotononidis]|uniref:aminomethyltransferase n=1 Tax=Microvirga lotononidis TaxID=864069 RepID=I4YQ02_9HYPH|nr:glycine cleavage system aminomethyltransferase GcvT [Microvirga lotononidis]EIM26044.1 glycine cleavage system T protein [Microvirga lotononidis]WQO25953.1 glycine cleavage system aminomethyltransferase GcvT [Microvirga lotononidis]
MAEHAHSDEPLLQTPLHAEHVALGARMVPFAGYDMPVQYPTGILTEHNWTREHAGLFDVSHMGQAFLVADDKSHETVARAIEALIPADVLNLKPNQQRYSQLLAEDGGILDDLMVTRVGAPGHEGWLYLVVNASMKEQDYAHIEARLPKGVALRRKDDLGLMALQGPSAEAVLARLVPEAAGLAFMMSADVQIDAIWCHVSRSGYTGEDGFEISCQGKDAPALWNKLLADPEVKAIGLGARDSLRLEAGLCLYGHDIDPTTSPIEAGLIWSIQKRRREEGGFPGAERVQREIKDGAARVRVGIRPEGRAPAREGTIITTPDGHEVGIVTSGGFGPTVNGPVAMGYVAKEVSAVGTDLHLIVRGKPLPAKVAAMPFAPHRYKR